MNLSVSRGDSFIKWYFTTKSTLNTRPIRISDRLCWRRRPLSVFRSTGLKVLRLTCPGFSTWPDLLPSHSVRPESGVCGHAGAWTCYGVPSGVVESMFLSHCPSHH